MKTLYISALMILLLVSITLVLPPAHGIIGSALFMKSNSTAKIYADFTVRVLNNETWNVGPPQIFTNMHDPSTNSPDLTIVADPNSIIGSNPNTNVTYAITANSHAKGVYALFLYHCGLTPLVVGENESQVNPATLRDYLTAGYSCPILTEDTPEMNIVGHYGIISKNITVNDNNTITVMPQNMTSPNNFPQPPPPSPLEQYKTGTATNNVKCNDGLQLVIKAEDGSPACVTASTAQKLIERGWAKETVLKTTQISPNQISNSSLTLPNPMTGLRNNEGIVSWKNQTYYFGTPNYTNDAYYNSPQISFHNVAFTLFPSGFRGGLPAIHCGLLGPGLGEYYWVDSKFSDYTHELLHLFAYSPSVCNLPIPSMFSNHANPQTGLAFYDGKMKLLVSVGNK